MQRLPADEHVKVGNQLSVAEEQHLIKLLLMKNYGNMFVTEVKQIPESGRRESEHSIAPVSYITVDTGHEITVFTFYIFYFICVCVCV